jgi:hypothetical protein
MGLRALRSAFSRIGLRVESRRLNAFRTRPSLGRTDLHVLGSGNRRCRSPGETGTDPDFTSPPDPPFAHTDAAAEKPAAGECMLLLRAT